MSLTVQQFLTDVKQLATRLKDRDSTIDTLVSQAQDVYKNVEAMKEYQEDLNELNNMAHQRPRASLVSGIQQENRHIRELQQENRELKTALEEHQNALELIMSKYRQQMVQLVDSNKEHRKISHNKDYSKMLLDRTDKVCEMAAVMNKAIHQDEASIMREKEMLSKLITENKGLRDLLEISCRNGSLRNSLLCTSMADKECQTEGKESS